MEKDTHKTDLTVADVALRLGLRHRKAGRAWREMDHWRYAALATQAASASYGTPPASVSGTPMQGRDMAPPIGDGNDIRVMRTELDLASPFPGDDGKMEYADLWEEIRNGSCKSSVFLDESSTCTQVWIVAVQMASGTSRVYCSFRGTSSADDVMTDGKFLKARGEDLKPMSDGWKATLSQSEIDSCALHRGFFGQYAAVAAAVREEIEKAAALLYKKHQFIVCGHSMGGALANICHFDLLASGLAKTESTGLVTIGSGPAGNSWFADVHDKLTRIEEDARRHLHIVNNNDPVPAAALGVEDGGSMCCIVAVGDGEAYEHSGTMIWMDRIPGKFRQRAIGMLGGLARVARRLVSPCPACCFHGTNVSVADHSTENYVTKMAEHLSARFGTPMRCLSS